MILPWQYPRHPMSSRGVARLTGALLIVAGFSSDAISEEGSRLWLTEDPLCPLYGVALTDSNKLTAWIGIALRGSLLLGDPDPSAPDLLGDATVEGNQMSADLRQLGGHGDSTDAFSASWSGTISGDTLHLSATISISGYGSKSGTCNLKRQV